MISFRSALSSSIIRGRKIPNITAAFLQTNIPFPSLSSSDQTKSTNGATSPPTIRYLSSPAYRRYVKKQQISENKSIAECIRSTTPEPTLEMALDMHQNFSQMENMPLVVIAEMGSHSARTEVLRRHIMAVDKVDYQQAGKTLERVDKKSRKYLIWYLLPYRIGIVFGMFAGFGIIPLTFDLNTAKVFNEVLVTAAVPPPADLETCLEISTWTWTWMGSATGVASFMFLAFQYVRQQAVNLGIRPFTMKIQKTRAQQLAKEFPQYNERLLSNYVKSAPMVEGDFRLQSLAMFAAACCSYPIYYFSI